MALVMESNAMQLKELALLMPELAEYLAEALGGKENHLITYISNVIDEINDEEWPIIGFTHIEHRGRSIYSSLYDSFEIDEVWEDSYKCLGILGVEVPDNDICSLDDFVGNGVKIKVLFFNKNDQYEVVKEVFPTDVVSPNVDMYLYLSLVCQHEHVGYHEVRASGFEPWFTSGWYSDAVSFKKKFLAYRKEVLSQCLGGARELMVMQMVKLKDIFLDKNGRSDFINEMIYPMEEEFYEQYKPPAWKVKEEGDDEE